jgi:tRNA threonylcarbamoyladenosine biosynthesis protein TsaB
MNDTTAAQSPWLLALESSTPHGGAALLQNGVEVDAIRLEEGLRHGRELVSSAARLLEKHSLAPSALRGVSVSEGPGSYTGIRVGVMAAKALAYGAGIRMASVSSLAALAQTLKDAGVAGEGDTVYTLQDARRDEVYAGVYRITEGVAAAVFPDAAVTPEEAGGRLRELWERCSGVLRLAGSGFATYRGVLLAAAPGAEGALSSAADGRVNPASVGVLGWRQILLEKAADPMQSQPVYLRRDEGSDWRHDHLITQA